MIETIKSLFDRRDKTFAKLTNEIIDAITPTVIAAVLEVLDLTSDERTRLNWHTVDYTEGHIVLRGSILYKEGDVIEEDDKSVTLTQAEAYLLGKFIRLALPIAVIGMSKDDIVKHLRDVEEKMKSDYEAVYKQPPEDDVINLEGDSLNEAFNKLPEKLQGNLFEENSLAGFDYTKLTKEQRKNLQLSQWNNSDDKKKVN